MKGREILFHGKSRNGKWHEGYYITQGPLQGIATKTLEIFAVLHETVGMYIQRTDKNGTKVFEGDLLRVQINEEYDPVDDYFLVEYVDNRDFFGFVLRDMQKGFAIYGQMFSQQFFTAYVEIIGNKWELPKKLPWHVRQNLGAGVKQ